MAVLTRWLYINGLDIRTVYWEGFTLNNLLSEILPTKITEIVSKKVQRNFMSNTHLILKGLGFLWKSQWAKERHDFRDCPKRSIWRKITFPFFGIFSWIARGDRRDFGRGTCRKQNSYIRENKLHNLSSCRNSTVKTDRCVEYFCLKHLRKRT